MSKPEVLVFYFPYRGVGGVPTLFLRLARALRWQYQIYLADYADGYMASHLPDGVHLIAVDQNPQFPPVATYVFQAFLPWRFPFLHAVGADAKFLFWTLHPKNFDPSIFNDQHRHRALAGFAAIMNQLAAPRKAALSAFLRFLIDRRAVIYQDRESIRSTQEMLGMRIDAPRFLPVPLEATALRKNNLTPNTPLCCAWVGRLCDFKYPILLHLIERLRGVAAAVRPVHLLVVGDGEFAPAVAEAARLSQGEAYRIELLGNVNEAELSSLLVERVDFLFAMGTSALEGARLGIPVLLTDYSYAQITGLYRFDFLFNNTGYCLGEQIGATHIEPCSSLENTLARGVEQYAALAQASYDYWHDHFSLDSVLAGFEAALADSIATFGEAEAAGFFRPDFWGKLLRSISVALRPGLARDSVGFRHDC